MNIWKIPPRAKVYEALSAVADGRVAIKDNNTALVTSSNGEKTYKVEWTPDFSAMSSNDNASVWQGYAGYPIIAVLLEAGQIAYEKVTIGPLAGIDWHSLNNEYKRDYDKAVSLVLAEIEKRGGDSKSIIAMADRIFADVSVMQIEKKRSVATRRAK
jgi:hypothetical protein